MVYTKDLAVVTGGKWCVVINMFTRMALLEARKLCTASNKSLGEFLELNLHVCDGVTSLTLPEAHL